MGLHLRKQGSINFSRLSSRPEFLTSFFACFSWLTQLIGTIMFSYSIYLQSLVVLGAFFYGMSAVLWAIKVWLSLNDSSQVTSRPCPNSKEPEENELNELPSQSE
jgi:apolipoprotein N-acyltransferase